MSLHYTGVRSSQFLWKLVGGAAGKNVPCLGATFPKFTSGGITARRVSSSYFEVAKRGTQLWIDELIIEQKICPFVKNSHIEIVVCPPQLHVDRMLDFMVDEVHDFDKSESPSGKYSCRLLVFPQKDLALDALPFLVLHRLEDQCGGVLGLAGSNYEPRDDRMTIQATFFQSPEGSDAGYALRTIPRNVSLNVQRLAPWNTLQMVKFAELKKARGRKARDRTDSIFGRNAQFDHGVSARYSDEVILEYFRNLRVRAKGKVIRVVQHPSEKDRERLEQEGYTIEIMPSNDQVSDGPKVNVAIRPRSSKKKSSSKTKTKRNK